MKKLILLFVLVAVFAGSADSSEKIKIKNLVGEWKYEVAGVPQGYESGTIIFEEKENQITGAVKFNDGYKVDFKSVEIKDDMVTFGLYVEYDYITGKAKVDGNKMKGTVNSPDGEVPLTAEKVK